MNNDAKNKLLETEEPLTSTTKPTVSSYDQNDYGSLYGDALNDENINAVISSVVPELIVLVGFANFGKSTLVGSIYHYFRKEGALCNYTLLDSDTFSGFERRTFLRSINNGGNSQVRRTLRGDNYYLTLDLVDGKKNYRKFIFSDKSGEIYSSYVSDESKLIQDNGLKKANHVVLFIDSMKLISSDRIAMMDDICSLLKRIISNSLFSCNTSIEVVFTKMDLISIEKMTKYKTQKDLAVEKIKGVLTNFEINIFEINAKDVDDSEYSIIPLFENLLNKPSIPKIENGYNKDQLDWVKYALKNTK
jgi:hypothetical protein